MPALEEKKSELVRKAAEAGRGRRGAGGPPRSDLEGLLATYYRHVPPEDVLERSPVDLYGALASQYSLAGERPQGTARIRVHTPTEQADGWDTDGHSVVEVVTDDMPFLVDSVTMYLTEGGAVPRNVHLVVHPQFAVERDITGRLLRVRAVDDGATDSAGGTVSHESWMHLVIDQVDDEEDARSIEAGLDAVLRDVREAVEDWPRMRGRIETLVEELSAHPPPVPPEEVEQAVELLQWLDDDHFTFLGYREYRLERQGEDEVLRAVPGTGYGILRSDPDQGGQAERLPPINREKAREKQVLVLAKANSRATVHRSAYLDYVGVKSFDADGEVDGERRFLGLFSSGAYTESVNRIPLLREKAAEVLGRVGFDPRSHAGKALMDTLETYPRDELFQTPVDELAPIALAVMHARERRTLRLFVRRDTYGRYLSCLVYLPNDRYSTSVRERFAAILKERLGGESLEFSARVNESRTARVHFVVRPPRGELMEEPDTEDLERRLAEAARSWRDDFLASVMSEYGEQQGTRLGRAYADSFPEAYKEDFSSRTAAADLGRLEALDPDPETGEAIDLVVYEPVDAGPGHGRVKVYRTGRALSLSEILPVLASMGVEVIDERPYELEGTPRPTWIYEFGLRYQGTIPTEARELFQDALRHMWHGRAEVDGFNELILAADLTWRQASVLRAYAKYMRQGGTPFSLDSIIDALREHVGLTRLLVEYFEARFDPRLEEDRDEAMARAASGIEAALEQVASLDHDRILRSYLSIMRGTLRTNYFQAPAGRAEHRDYTAFKLEPAAIPELPEPRPTYEIFVHSPRVEGVHLRFGTVARGGLRWSDRRDDFRTEVLGLVKAQMVKNAVIVPVGAKGGFYAKHLPDPSDRDAWMAEGIACYRIFISGLLDLTDNLLEGKTVPPTDVVRHDGDDPYLVVAADKGTASFSDIANELAKDYGFWLGDAFASGGSVGYDHKAMGITARGAWVSVQRHFREMGVDCQSEDFTAVGIGDMSGDVFGNGMLCSEHTRLVAAFDHRDIFLDPDPDPTTSYAERKRLFDTPRSTWADYDPDLISPGGGVHSRKAKSVEVTPEVRRALDLPEEVERLAPNELIRAILLAPVDLLWNGGIGTYVKASTETHADVGDKANDGIRVDGHDLRARCVGEGGNLGFTQLGRIEYARNDGRINTDFIDNSAGVDTSDHEVNIKVLLDRVVDAGDMTTKQRNELLASMTDEVADLVLADNYDQNLALANATANAPALLHVHEDWMRALERDGVLDRELEDLPPKREVRRRLEHGEGLCTPELSVLMAWTKIQLADRLLESDLPDDDYLRSELFGYFPAGMRQHYRGWMAQHPLRREIVVTQVVNDLVNGAGITYWHRLAGETGASAPELVRANFIAREIFGAEAVHLEIGGYDNHLGADVQTRMRLEMRTLVERASRWLVNNRRSPLDSEGIVDFFGPTVQQVMARLPEVMDGRELAGFVERRDRLTEAGAPTELATRIAVLPPSYAVLGVVETAAQTEVDPLEVARIHFAVGERLGLPTLVQRILALPRHDRWQTMARASLRDDLHGVHAQLTRDVLAVTDPDEPTPVRIADWEERGADEVARSAETLEEICADEDADLARMSVGLRVVRGLLDID